MAAPDPIAHRASVRSEELHREEQKLAAVLVRKLNKRQWITPPLLEELYRLQMWRQMWRVVHNKVTEGMQPIAALKETRRNAADIITALAATTGSSDMERGVHAARTAGYRKFLEETGGVYVEAD